MLPSATEILFAIGAGDDVVGVTFECDYPPQARSRRNVSTSTLTEGLTPAQIDAQVRARLAAGEDLYRLDEGALRDLDPELIVTQDLCAVCAVDVGNVEAALEHLGCDGRVLTLDPSTLEEVLLSIATVGAATGHEQAAGRLTTALRSRLARVAAAVSGRPRPGVAVLEWTDPPFTAGHWVPDMVTAAGARPTLGRAGERSAQTTWAEIASGDPDLVVIAPCGYGLADAVDLARTVAADALLPANVPVWAVDADAAFVRPGPRLVDGVEALAGICHADVMPARPDLATLVRRGACTPTGAAVHKSAKTRPSRSRT